jgi:lipase maturation factor 1
MIYDGDCSFCCRWIARWRRLTGSRVDYATSAEAASRFPEIPPEAFREAVQLVDTSGEVFAGAAAAIRSVRHLRPGRLADWARRRLPGAARCFDGIYRFIARRRGCRMPSGHS